MLVSDTIEGGKIKMPTYYDVDGVRIEIHTRENGHNEPMYILYMLVE